MDPFTRDRRRSVASLGESRLIAEIGRWLGKASPPAPRGPGDDCAVLAPARGRRLLTVDPVVYGRHFDATAPPAAAGAKLLKRNVSDIAAMGGRPTSAVVSLLLDPSVRLDWLEPFIRGLGRSARRWGVEVVGGDVAQADGVLAASLALLGTAGPRALTRRGARPGDAICVTGVLGGSLRSGHHLRFVPRLAEGAWLARRPEVRAMLDVSDGLAKDLRSIAPRGAVPALSPDLVPRRRGASLEEALAEGEDYELAFALDRRADWRRFLAAWRRAFPRTRLARIGSFVRRGRIPPGAVDLAALRGYEHLGGP